MTIELLKLAALDAEDLQVLAAHGQDALIKPSDIAWLPMERRFVLAMRRFDWDAPENEPRRRLAALHFDRVSRVMQRGIDRTSDVPLNLLTITFSPTEPPSGVIELIFSAGAAIRLEVECIEAQLADIGPAWEVAARPHHAADKT